MCGRTACTLGPNDIVRRCASTLPETSSKRPVEWVDNRHDGHAFTTSFNKAPGSVCPVLVAKKHLPKMGKDDDDDAASGERKNDDGEDVCIFPMLWGLVPAWHEGHPRKTGLSTSNCRSEGMFEKKMFSECLHRHLRCVIVVDGFYEWKTSEVVKPGAAKKTTTTKQPYFIFDGTKATEETTTNETTDPAPSNTAMSTDSCDADSLSTSKLSPSSPPSHLLAIAGLFRVGSPRAGEGRDPKNPLYSYSIITVPSAPTMKWLHERQPAVLTSEEEILRWLSDGELTNKEVKELIRPVDSLGFYPVSSLVNNARVDDEKCMAPIDLQEEEEKKKPKPNALTNWLAKGATTTSSAVTKKEESVRRKESKDDLMTAWLAKGKRKSDVVDDNETGKKTK